MCEVVYPTSRAVELENEDAEEERNAFFYPVSPPVARLSKTLRRDGTAIYSGSPPVSCKLLVLAFGRIATTFVEAYFLNKDSVIVGVVVGAKKERDFNSVLQTEPSDKTCFIHSHSYSNSGHGGQETGDVLFCQSKVDYPEGYCHGWANEVFSSVKPDKVLVLASIPSSLCVMNDEDDLLTNCVFSLKTNNWKSPLKFPFLNSPNIVTGLPAAVMTHCQIFATPAVTYVGITENQDIDSRTLSLFAPLLNVEPLKELPKRPKLETKEFIKAANTVSSHLESNLYI